MLSISVLSVLLLVLSVLKLNEGCPPIISEDTPATRETNASYFLPKNVQPIRYTITLEPKLEEEIILGSVTLELQALEDTKNITIEIRSITINDSTVSVTDSSGVEIPHSDPSWYNTTEFYVINLEEALKSGETYYLTIGSYEGVLHSDNGGFYLAKYTDEDGNERRLATTQFESTNARRAFPCLDEPALKAKFVVNLIRPENYSSLSNEISNSVNLSDGRFRDEYSETVKMSTYLAAFVVSDYDFVKNGSHKVHARPQAVKQGLADYSLKAGIELLKIIEDFVQVEYSLQKMDQISFPDDYFAAGAMENWGLVTYRESYLLYSENYSTTSELQRVATVIAHEFGHQWFGNLVTLAWWEYLWLNEGFATYFEYFAASQMEPSWRLMEQFVPVVVQYALGKDNVESTQPMNYATEYPGGGATTYVSYQKSGSVIRMFEHFLTTEVYRKGLTSYLTSKQYDAATPSDLYDALQEAVETANKTNLLGNLSISAILTTWDSQKGYPVVTIERDYNTGYLTITQSRYLLKNSSSDTDDVWIIPINFAFEDSYNFNQTTADAWITQKKQFVNNSYDTNGWLIANKQETGFYRVNYDETNWQKIIDYLNSDNYEEIHVLNRAQLIDDAFNLARSGRLDYRIPFELSKYLTKETDYIPWYSYLTAFDFLNTIVAENAEYDTLKDYTISLMRTAYDSLGLAETESDSHTDKLNRANILKWLCKLGDAECRAEAISKLRLWNTTGESISPNLQTAFFCGAAAVGDENDFAFLYSLYETTSDTMPLLRTRIINGLGCSENEDILKRYLDLATNTNSSMKSSHRTTAFAAVYNAGNTGLRVAFDYVKNYFENVKNTLSISTILSGIGARLTTQEQLDELTQLSEVNSDDKSSFSTAIESATENVQWINDSGDDISAWLKEMARGSSSFIQMSNKLIVFSLWSIFLCSILCSLHL